MMGSGHARRRVEGIDGIVLRGAGLDRADDGDHVVVGDGLAIVRDGHQGAIDLDEFIRFDLQAELGAAPLDRVAARMLAEHERIPRRAHVLGAHDLRSLQGLRRPGLL